MLTQHTAMDRGLAGTIKTIKKTCIRF